jgi:hypothetical protein
LAAALSALSPASAFSALSDFCPSWPPFSAFESLSPFDSPLAVGTDGVWGGDCVVGGWGTDGIDGPDLPEVAQPAASTTPVTPSIARNHTGSRMVKVSKTLPP